MDAINTLKNGYKQFFKEYFESENPLYPKLVKRGQKPQFLVICCADSRVDPGMITQAEPGDLFIVRNVANLVSPFIEDPTHHGTSTAIEYAVCYLGVKHIIVMGHSHCGGIQAIVDKQEPKEHPSFIPAWMAIADPVCEQVLAENPGTTGRKKYELCEQASIIASVENLHRYPWVEKRIKNQEVMIHGWYFDMDTGKILALDKTEHAFTPLFTS